jgi:primary-amine oxidase
VSRHAPATHPLDPLSADELRAAREVLAAAGKLSERTRLALVVPEEPAKEQVLAAERDGEPVDRRALLVVLDTSDGCAHEAVVSLDRRELVAWREVPTGRHPYGQPPITNGEFEAVDEIVKLDPRWRRAMADRGVTDLSLVFVTPLSAGQFGFPEEAGRRLLRSLAFVRHHPEDSPWAHPVDGLVAYVDLIARRVVEVVDTGVVPVPKECGNFAPRDQGPGPLALAPLEIRQPEGPGFTVAGNQVSWANWRLRLSFNAREGLVLHQVRVVDGGRERPVLYRASIAELVVPYADPSPTRFWISYFDAGEYSLGRCVNSLMLGCDCLGEIRYLDVTLADDHGAPYVVRNAICLHEEDVGVLWKHTDEVTGTAGTQRSRRLVVSFFATVGNYDYGFFWYLYLDGTIRMEVKLTGVLFTGAVPPGAGHDHATEVAPGLVGAYHQHLFCARLDMTVDGTANTVSEVEVERVPTGDGNPYGNAFRRRATVLASESKASRMADPSVGRAWVVENPGSRNRLGQPSGYMLVPRPGPALLAQPGSAVAARAAFATRHLWVTRYDPAERYPAGDYPNQHAGGAGLPEWTAADRPLEGQDVVLWHTFGSTHLPRTEDWPVMPVESTGFTLRPVGFFDRNPATG